MGSNQMLAVDSQDEHDFLFVMQLTTGSMLCMAVQVAVELNVFDIIAEAGPGAKLTSADIVSRLCTENPNAPAMLDRVLHLLATHSVLIASTTERPDGIVERQYGLGSVCKYFVRNQDGVSLSPLLVGVQHQKVVDIWYHLKDAILEGGIAFNRAHGMHLFEFMGVYPKLGDIFNEGMFNQTTIIMKKIVEAYKGFEELSELVDVGGGFGTTMNIITSKYPLIKGTNFDLPHVIARAQPYPGVEHVVGNMFECFPKCEAIFMKWILHDWNNEQCLKILKNCYKALPDTVN